MRKIFLTILIFGFLLTSCIGQKNESISGNYTYLGTSLTLTLPKGWLKTNIPGYTYPIFFTAIDNGIKPNLKFEEVIQTEEVQDTLEKYTEKQKKIYADYQRVQQTQLTRTDTNYVIKTIFRRINRDNIPIIDVSYCLLNEKNGYLIIATCAEASKGRFEPVFDTIVNTAKF